jgi:hypothetical protein
MAGSPEGVSRARLVGGVLDAVVIATRPGQEIIELGGDFLVLFGGQQEFRERLERSRFQYGYARVEVGPEGDQEAIFEFVREVPLGEPGQ